MYLFTLSSVQETPQSDSQCEIRSPEGDIEKQLRQMLTGVDVIPFAAQSSGAHDMVDHCLPLEMKIDDFELARTKVGMKWNIQYFLELLRRKFDDQQPQRLENLSPVSLQKIANSQMEQLTKSSTMEINCYRDALRFQLIKKRPCETQPLAEIADELCRDAVRFNRFFERRMALEGLMRCDEVCRAAEL